LRSGFALWSGVLFVTAALLPACSRGGRDGTAPANSPWIVETNEALDALMLVNAISPDPHYGSRYPGLRSAWAARLGPEGMATADSLFGAVSMSGAARLLYTLRPNALDDLAAAFQGFEESRGAIERSLAAGGGGTEYERQDLAALGRCRSQFLGYVQALRKAEYSKTWEQECKPLMEKQAAQLKTGLAELPNADTERVLTRFLGCARAPTHHIILLYYASPIAFQLRDGVMASEASESGFLSKLPWLGEVFRPGVREKALRFGSVALHESLHNFPRSAEVTAIQDAAIARRPALAREYTALREKWHEGPEEYAVVAAEAYLSEVLRLRSRAEAANYIAAENGGMTFSMAIYKRLSATRPDTQPDWPGYSEWLISAMRSGLIP